MLRDAQGNLYGTTAGGGVYGTGAIFKLEPNGNETVLSSLTSDSGLYPFGGLVQDEVGNLYGTTQSGSTNGIN